MLMTPIEFASLRELERRVVDTNGCDLQAGAELRRRGLAARLGARRNPADCLRELEARRNGPDCRTPAERVVGLWAQRHPTARGADPRQLLLQLHALRIDEGW